MKLIATAVLSLCVLGSMLLDRYDKWWTKRWREKMDNDGSP